MCSSILADGLRLHLIVPPRTDAQASWAIRAVGADAGKPAAAKNEAGMARVGVASR